MYMRVCMCVLLRKQDMYISVYMLYVHTVMYNQGVCVCPFPICTSKM